MGVVGLAPSWVCTRPSTGSKLKRWWMCFSVWSQHAFRGWHWWPIWWVQYTLELGTSNFKSNINHVVHGESLWLCIIISYAPPPPLAHMDTPPPHPLHHTCTHTYPTHSTQHTPHPLHTHTHTHTQEQYILVHEVLKNYMNSFDQYANFAVL